MILKLRAIARYGIAAAVAATAGAPLAAFAQQINVPAPNPPTTLRGLLDLTVAVGRTMFVVLVILAFVMFLVAGFYYVLTGTDEKNKEKAKNYLTYGVVAIVVGFLAFGLAQVVVLLLSGGGAL